MSANEGKCLIHYEHLATEDASLTPLNRETFQRLLQSKDARINLGGAHVHEKQMNAIPKRFVQGQYYVHRLCYQRFTKAVSVQAKKASKKNIGYTHLSPLKRSKRVTGTPGTLFPNMCMKCKSSLPLKVKGKKRFIRVLQTFSACKTVKLAAVIHSDDEMLRQVTGEDLIAKEFKMHLNCYKEYTRVCSKQSLGGISSLSVNEDSENETRTANNFKTVCSFIVDHVIRGHQSVSIKVLTEMYGFDKEDSRLRSKVKQRIENEFGDKIAFVSIAYHESQIVVSRSVLEDTCVSNFIKENKKFILKESARHLWSDITEMISKAPELPWPPTTEALSWPDRQPPESVKELFRSVLHSTHHTPGDDVCRYVESFSQDLVYAVSRGDFFTEKHVVLGTGLHSLTGQKTPIKLLGKLGHSCTYDKVRLIETTQAELIQHLRSLQHPLLLAPASDTGKVLTYFWCNNFDIKKDNAQGSLHTTHGVAYQEESVNCIKVNTETVILKSKRRSVISQPHQLSFRKVDPRKEPALFEQLDSMDIEKLLPEKIVLLWKIM